MKFIIYLLIITVATSVKVALGNLIPRPSPDLTLPAAIGQRPGGFILPYPMGANPNVDRLPIKMIDTTA